MKIYNITKQNLKFNVQTSCMLYVNFHFQILNQNTMPVHNHLLISVINVF